MTTVEARREAEDKAQPAHERSDAPSGAVALALLALLTALALSLLIVAGITGRLGGWRGVAPATPRAPPTRLIPRLEIARAGDRAAIEQAAREKLQGYAPIDQDHARIPIERAMEILASQGWPDAEESGGKP